MVGQDRLVFIAHSDYSAHISRCGYPESCEVLQLRTNGWQDIQLLGNFLVDLTPPIWSSFPILFQIGGELESPLKHAAVYVHPPIKCCGGLVLWTELGSQLAVIGIIKVLFLEIEFVNSAWNFSTSCRSFRWIVNCFLVWIILGIGLVSCYQGNCQRKSTDFQFFLIELKNSFKKSIQRVTCKND